MLGVAVAASPASAEPVIGVAAPLSGPMAVIGRQLADGARHAALRGAVPIEIVDDACTPDGGKAAAEEFLARKVAIVIGFACVEAAEAALPLLSASSIPVISPVIRAAHLTDRRRKSGYLFYRLAPRGDDEAAAMAAIMKTRWTDRHFAILDDGTLASRDFAESFRLRMEEAGLKPALIDSYRPAIANQVGLVRRVARSGATHVLVSGDRDDVAVIARDARENANEIVEVAAGEALRAAPGEVPLGTNVMMVATPVWADFASALAGELRGGGIEPDGYVIPSFAAYGMAAEALRDSPANPAAGLEGHAFATALGTVSFDADGNWTAPPFVVFRYDDGAFVVME